MRASYDRTEPALEIGTMAFKSGARKAKGVHPLLGRSLRVRASSHRLASFDDDRRHR